MAEPVGKQARISPWEDAPLGFPANILPFPSLPADWSTDRLSETLHQLFVATVRATQSRIDWYDRKAVKMGLIARAMRTVAIILAGLAALAPLIGPLLPPAILGITLGLGGAQVGYVALAIAGLLVALDNFFGYSTSWMRYRVSQADLVRRLARFRYDWVGRLALLKSGTDLGPADRKALVDLLRAFVDAVEATVERETQVWADSLKVSLVAFDRQNHFQRYDEIPGTLEVTIANYADLKKDTVKLTVDEKEVSPDNKGVASMIRQPGPCAAKLSAKKQDNTDVAAEGNTQVQTGQTTSLTLTAT
jgi:hypothetical protein